MLHIQLILVVSVTHAAIDSRIPYPHNFRIVNTTQGPVKGYKSDEVFHFYGIPYATAPTGVRRFTEPQPGPIWRSPLVAINKNIICPQSKSNLLDVSNYDMREDCLIANVHVPDTDETSLPVVVYIHGGAYHMGYGEIATPIPLVRTKKVIAVTFNYRLGVHGFLCLGTVNAPGNAGMKDQVALLRWVQKNIASFGGNPDEVTIAGYSAGSSSVDLLMLSDVTDGLFNKAIPESGAGVSVWGIQRNPVQNAIDFAKKLNFTDVDLNSLDEFYTTFSYDDLMSDHFLTRPDSTFVFSPCVEHGTGVEKFLEDAPLNILIQGNYRNISILRGFTNMEGFFRVVLFDEWKELMNEKFSDFLPADLQFEDDEKKEEVAGMIKKFYFGEDKVSEENIQGYIDYFSDVMFVYPNLRSVKLQVEAGSNSIYLYEYSFFRSFATDAIAPDYIRNLKGAGHVAQSFAILHNPGYEDNYGPDSDEYRQMKETMVELWVNFITTGKPVPEGSDLPSWPPVGASVSPHMELGEKVQLKRKPVPEGSDLPSWPPVGASVSPHMELGEKVQLKGSLWDKRACFWDSIYDKYYDKSVVPPSATKRSEL